MDFRLHLDCNNDGRVWVWNGTRALAFAKEKGTQHLLGQTEKFTCLSMKIYNYSFSTSFMIKQFNQPVILQFTVATVTSCHRLKQISSLTVLEVRSPKRVLWDWNQDASRASSSQSLLGILESVSLSSSSSSVCLHSLVCAPFSKHITPVCSHPHPTFSSGVSLPWPLSFKDTGALCWVHSGNAG